MAKRTYDQRLNNTKDWIAVINEYWDKHQGLLNNKKDFWDSVMHTMTNEDWLDIYTVADISNRQDPEDFRKYPNFWENLNDLNKRLQLGNAVIKKFDRQQYNKAPFQILMAVKDHINSSQGTATKQFKEIVEVKQPTTKHEKRLYRKEINIQIQETLFEIIDE